MRRFLAWLRGWFAHAESISTAESATGIHETRVILPDGRCGVIDCHGDDGMFAVRVDGGIVFVPGTDLRHPE